MALDTKRKRASVQAYTLGLMRPPPDGTIDGGDRATVAWFYSGLNYSQGVRLFFGQTKLTMRMGFRM